jgi:uncharacterized membrane protein YeiB
MTAKEQSSRAPLPSTAAIPADTWPAKLVDFVPRLLYLGISIILLGIAFLLAGYGLWEVWAAVEGRAPSVMDKLLDAIGVIVIALALFDVSKFIVEEEVMHRRALMRPLHETRRALSKFMSIIAIAVCMEALVFVFRAGKSDVSMLLYPTLLLLAGVAVVLGLSVFMRSGETQKSHARTSKQGRVAKGAAPERPAPHTVAHHTPGR